LDRGRFFRKLFLRGLSILALPFYTVKPVSSSPKMMIGKTPHSLDASEAISDFFSHHAL
jgi:hypothetical protein